VAPAVIAAPEAVREPADVPPAPGAAASAAPAGGAAGRPVVFAAGRLAAQKGFGVLLEAAAAWRDLEPVPLVVIAGDGPLARQLRTRAAEVGAAAVFLGQRDDVPARLAGAAVFVLPSNWEGQPLVLQEALRAGAAIVATRVGGVPGLTGEDAALLVPPGDARALAAAVRSVLSDQGLALRLRAAARARGAALPTAGDAVTAVLASYAAVAG
jgi:glycosyltransferase involved in cell wall biosynthesis